MSDSKSQQELDKKNAAKMLAQEEHKAGMLKKSQDADKLKHKVAVFFGGSAEGREIFTLLSLHYQTQQIADPEKTHAHACFNQGKLEPFRDIAKWIKQINKGGTR